MITPGAFLVRLAAAVLAGALIGLERQWRSRGAGLRTNTLVATGAAMFVLIAQLAGPVRDANQTQITAYVVSGVGFLGAGVIISDGTSIRGINTAATIWCAAAAGALAASGDVWEAGVGTAAILLINVALRPLGRRIDRRPLDQADELETTYRLRATTQDQREAHIRALLLGAISGHGYRLRSLQSTDIDGTSLVEITAELTTVGRNDEQIEAAAGRLGLEPEVTAVRWRAITSDDPGPAPLDDE